jgi:three-Cys-motif partner protein
MIGRGRWEKVPLFDHPAGRRRPRRDPEQLIDRLWTEHKALLIARYLYYFVLITHHGTYIDGFAGPQDPRQPGSWAARLVLDLRPAWMRHLHLFELDRAKLASLERLRVENPERVRLYPGDFNQRVQEILIPDVIRQNEATFCLLDQHTFECRWSTVRRLAEYKTGRWKIELFYFLAEGWFERAMAASTTAEGRHRIEEWWGGADWQELQGMPGLDRALRFAGRLRDELGYQDAWPYAINQREGGGRVMYWMIHATDHDDARSQMDRAYRQVVLPNRLPPPPQLW